MNNDQQIDHINSRFDTLEHQNKVILDNLFIKLKVYKVLQESSLGAIRELNVIGIMETAEGVVIRVR